MTKALFALTLAQRINHLWVEWARQHCDSLRDAPNDAEIVAMIQEALDAEFPPEQSEQF